MARATILALINNPLVKSIMMSCRESMRTDKMLKKKRLVQCSIMAQTEVLCQQNTFRFRWALYEMEPLHKFFYFHKSNAVFHRLDYIRQT
jgi:hypothetical protein